jgi:signal transduction histidine kinase
MIIGNKPLIKQARSLKAQRPGQGRLRREQMKSRDKMAAVSQAAVLDGWPNALLESEERYRTLFEMCPMGVYSCDRAGMIQKFNLQAVKLWGREPKLGDSSERFCGSFKMYRTNGSFMPHAQCPMAVVLSGKAKRAHNTEAVIERPNGSKISVNVNIVPLKNKRGGTIGAINCFYDISERKHTDEIVSKARKVLDKHTKELERLVAERTAELLAANKRLGVSVESTREGKEQYHKLFLESQAMHKKLRQLTHQIISAQEEERKEISRELHDEVVQTLVGINVELSALGKGASVGVQTLKEKIAHTQRLVENSVNAVHRFARELRPAVLDDLGLIPALHAYGKSLAERKKFKIQMTAFGGVEALGGAKRTVLFRVAQEALTNIARHANASQVRMSISEVLGAIRMEISDNGKSFHVDKALQANNNKRLGLIGMRERVEMVGGKLTIESTSGKGTTVRAEIPFTPEKTKK